jgi:transposase
MATIIKKIKKGRPYYYAVESARVNGKPRIVWQKYLGTVEGIVKRAEQSEPLCPREVDIFELGGVAALARIAQRLELEELICEVVPKREQGPSVGQYMLLAAINRALDPCSKLAIGDWYSGTALRRLWGHPESAFTSQRFWDHMDMVSEEAIREIEERLVPRIVERFGLDPSLLLYDTTNFFTFISTTNERAALPARGHSKAKRHDLRQVGLALLVTRDFSVPLLHHLYAGNTPDVTLFPSLARKLAARYAELAGAPADATLVFDKGNVSDDAIEGLIARGIHFVCALPAPRVPELMRAPLEEFRDLEGMPGSRTFAAGIEGWGAELRTVVVLSESFFAKQLHGLTGNMSRCQAKLTELEKSLGVWASGKGRGKKPTLPGVRARLREILSAQFMAELFSVEVGKQGEVPTLSWRFDHAAFEELCAHRLGRTVLLTDRDGWPDAEVARAYRGLSAVEEAFRNMKNTHFLHFQPAWHWTDQKLRVHAFYCVLALTLSTLAHKVACEAGQNLSLAAMLKELTSIREVAIIYPSGAHRKNQLALSRMSARQKKLFDILDVGGVLSW